MNEFYRTLTLPHWHPLGATLFITFRLAESLPKSLISELYNQKIMALAEAEQIKDMGHSFWAKDYYGTWLRNNNRFDACVWYILKNPVKAGVCDDWKAYPHSYASTFGFSRM